MPLMNYMKRLRQSERRLLPDPQPLSPAHSVQRDALRPGIQLAAAQDVAQVVHVQLQELGGEAVDPGEVLQQELVRRVRQLAARESESASEGPDLHAVLQRHLLHQGVAAGLEQPLHLEAVCGWQQLDDGGGVHGHVPRVGVPEGPTSEWSGEIGNRLRADSII